MVDHTFSCYFLVGPTASGKSEVAHQLAVEHGFDILSADSMLVYRGLDVGTAKPGARERGQVRYGGLDLISPGEPFSVAAYLERVRPFCQAAQQAGRTALVVGGTGLYIKCLVEGLARLPAENIQLRAEAERVYREQGLPALQEMVKQYNPAAFSRLADPKNPRRLIRALEITPSSAEATRKPSNSTLVGLKCAPGVVYERITARVEAMYAGGLLDEAKKLKVEYPQLSHTALQAIGYREALSVIEGTLSVPQARQQTITRTRQLAKRQMTWFRHQARVDWIEVTPDTTPPELGQRVMNLWKKHGPTPLSI